MIEAGLTPPQWRISHRPRAPRGRGTDLLPQALQLGGHLRLPVLFVGLHLVGQLLFRHFTEDVLYRFLKRFFLTLRFLSRLLQDLSFMGLEESLMG